MVHLKRALKVCATLAVLALSLWFVNAALMRYETYDKYKTFMESKTDYDMVFLGSSHVLYAVNPMQLWQEWGIAGYNFGYHSLNIPMNFWQVQIAKNYHKPKAAMMDIAWLWSDFKDDKVGLPDAHNALDPFPLFHTKWQAVRDLCAKPESRIELLFPFYSYHNRWKDSNFKFDTKATLRKLRGKYNPYTTKGMNFCIAVRSDQFPGFEVPTRYDGAETTSMEYCKRFIAWCKKNDIVPVFMFVPYSGAVSTPESRDNLATWFAALRSIIEEDGGFFLDMAEGLVDFDIDMYDLASHLNPSGARKVTDAIGAFLSETLGCQSHKDDPAFAAWHGDYDAYRQWLLGTIARQDDFKNLLMMTNHAEVYAAVRAGNNAAFDAVEEKLLFENWSDIRFERTGAEDAAVTVTVFERGTDREVVTRRFEKR